MKTLGFLISLSLTCFLFPAQGQSACERNYEIGVVFTSTDKDSDNAGKVFTDLLNEIQNRQACIYTEKLISLTRATEDLRNHRIDMFAFAFPNDNWNTFSTYLPLFSVKRLLLVQKKHFKVGATIQDYIQNPKVKFGVLSGTTFLMKPKELASLEKHNRVQFLPSPANGVDFFIKNKLDAMFFTPITYQRYAEKFKLRSKAMLVVDTEEPVPLSLFFSRKRVSEEEIKNFASILLDLKKEGAFKKVLRNYVSDDDIKNFYSF